MLLSFWLTMVAAAVSAASTSPSPVLSIDDCVTVDQLLVREIMTLELGEGQAARPESITVRCLDELQEIRVEPWASKMAEGSRIIQLAPVRDAASPPERQARSRELALAIAEFIRRLETAPVPEPPPPPPLAPVVAPPVLVEEKPSAPPSHDKWTLGTVSTFDHFLGGQDLFGGELILAARWGRWLVTELGLGGRMAGEQTLSMPPGRLSKRALTASAAVGLSFVPQGRRFGATLRMRVREYLVQYHAESALGSGSHDELVGATVVAAEPCFNLALTRRISLEASAGIGTAMRGIKVRLQGVETQSLSGLVLSGSLGVGVRF